MTKIKAIFLDAGNTLLHAYPGVGEIYAEVTSQRGVSLPPAIYRNTFAMVFHEFIGAITRRGEPLGPNDDTQDYEMWRTVTQRVYELLPALHAVEFTPWFEALHDRFGRPDSWKLFDDVLPSLDALKQRGLKVGILSNWDTRLRNILRGLNLLGRVDDIVISSEVNVSKPDPRIFKLALSRIGVSPQEAIHVGDLYEIDVVGAQKVGIRPVLITRSSNPMKPPPAECEKIASTSEILGLV